MNKNQSARRSRRGLYLPAALFLLVAAVWSGGWFYAAQRAETLISAWIEREAQVGRTYGCAERTVGGYPFRIEVTCTEPSAELRERDGTVSLKARRLIAVAQIYQPDLVIAEVEGPMTVADAGSGQSYVAEWALLQTSLRGRPKALHRISLVADKPKLTVAGAPAGAEPVAHAQRLEVHVRRRDDANAAEPVFDLGLRLADGAMATIPALTAKPVSAEAGALLRGVRDFSAKPLPQRLREWQAAGGRLELVNARVQQGDALAVAKGDIGLTPDGRLDGAVNLTLAGFDQLVGQLLGQGGGPGRTQTSLLAGFAMLGRAEIEGRRAIAVPLRFKDGRIYLGPVPIGQTHPVF